MSSTGLSKNNPNLKIKHKSIFVTSLSIEAKGTGAFTVRDLNPEVHMVGMIIEQCSWIIDSGATEHITYDTSLFRGLIKQMSNFLVKVATRESVLIKEIGDIRLTTRLLLHNILHILAFQCNLISVH